MHVTVGQPSNMSAADVTTLATHANYETWATGGAGALQSGLPSDDLTSRVATAASWLHSVAATAGGTRRKPLMLYAHCAAGCDRTGEFIAAYTMKMLRWNFTRSIEWSRTICAGNPPVYWNMLASQWYCESLRAAGDSPWLTDCGNCKPFYCEPPPAQRV